LPVDAIFQECSAAFPGAFIIHMTFVIVIAWPLLMKNKNIYVLRKFNGAWVKTDMNLKIVIMISMFLAQTFICAGLEPLYLGSGPSDLVINLDAGARLPGQSYNFAPSGFVTPMVPQTMALSSNIMITQSRKLMNEAQLARDEAVSARDEAKAIYNETRALLEEINSKEQNIQSLQKSVEADREAAAASAAQAGAFLNKTDEIYGMIMALSVEIEDNLSEIKTTLQEVGAYVDAIEASRDAFVDDSDIDSSKAIMTALPANQESENREESVNREERMISFRS
jgi:hypothetical protein